MGATLHDLRTILRFRDQGLLNGKFSVAEIGAQQLGPDILRDPDILPAYARAFGVPLRGFGSAPPRPDSVGIEHMQPEAPFAKEFWDWLGCRYMAIDYDTSPHTIPLDLNFDDAPAEHRGKYDLVTNFGTTEHIVNQMQAMKVIHDLVAPGGLMFHTVPAQGYMTHGLFNYNPMFFWTLSRSCRYHIYEMRFNFDAGAVAMPPNVIEFVGRSEPEKIDRLNDHRMVDSVLLVVMQKREDIPFVPPIEIHAGVTDDAKLRARYWTVLNGKRPESLAMG